MKIDVNKLISFFDAPKDWSIYKNHLGSHAAAINILIGEDLILALLKHYFQSINIDFSIYSYKCNQNTRNGKRLDAWVKTRHNNISTLFQTEIKNWSGHSLGGYNLSCHANDNELDDFSEMKYSYYFGNISSVPPEINKVYINMSPPMPDIEIKKLLCFWFYIVNINREPFFTIHNSLGELNVFSGSAYLRSIKDNTIELELPRVSERLNILSSILSF